MANINYPPENYVDEWVDKYLDKHPNEKIADFKELEEMAMSEWWDNEVDHNRPTPFDLTKEQEKVSKEARSIGTKAKSEKPRAKRERKVDEDKHEIFETLNKTLTEIAEKVEVLNEDREVIFFVKGRKFKVVLSCPRK